MPYPVRKYLVWTCTSLLYGILGQDNHMGTSLDMHGLRDNSRNSLTASTEEHPRPQFRREFWYSLNGVWDFYIDAQGVLTEPASVPWDREIVVPFSPETKASAVAHPGFYSAVWYRRNFRLADRQPAERLIVHFEAVDYRTSVWVNGAKVCEHEGGYTPFFADITAALKGSDEEQEIIVRAEDDPADLAKPRGKQDWRLEPHSIWYPRTTGIWQTVWLERVPPARLDTLYWTSNLTRWEIGLDATVSDCVGQKLSLTVKLMREHIMLATDTYEVVSGEVHRRIALSDPGHRRLSQ